MPSLAWLVYNEALLQQAEVVQLFLACRQLHMHTTPLQGTLRGKCVTALLPTHCLQLVLLAIMWYAVKRCIPIIVFLTEHWYCQQISHAGQEVCKT